MSPDEGVRYFVEMFHSLGSSNKLEDSWSSWKGTDCKERCPGTLCRGVVWGVGCPWTLRVFRVYVCAVCVCSVNSRHPGTVEIT